MIILVVTSICLKADLAWGEYPDDPASDIEWSVDFSDVSDIENAFNTARSSENVQLGTSVPMLTMPSQDEWDVKSDGAKALWLINKERIDRGIQPLYGIETNVTGVAQSYAEYLLDNNVFGHFEDGNTPQERLTANPDIGACSNFWTENLALFCSTSTIIPLPIERSIYNWMYDDSSSNWGHRHIILWYPFDDDSGPSGEEGFLGIGRAIGSHSGWPNCEIVVMNVFDPCSSWAYPATLSTDLQQLYIPLLEYDSGRFWVNLEYRGGAMFEVTDLGLAEGDSESATLSTDLQQLYIPLLEYDSGRFWVNLEYRGGAMFEVTDLGLVE